MLYSILFLAAGFFLVIKGADLLVDGASSLAKRYKVSELTIGLTIVAFGTSAPELVVNVIAAINEYDDVSMGNIIGSNLFNLFLILGISGLIFPIMVQSKTVWKEIPLSFFSGLLLFVLANDILLFNSSENYVSRLDAAILMIVFAFFIIYAFRNRKEEPEAATDTIKVFGVGKTVLFIASGFVFLIFGGRIVVNNAVKLAHMLEINEKIIGLTIVAAGTSLPELATSAVAAFKKRSDLAIGNVIGSNIFNFLFILGITAFIRPVRYDFSFNFDLVIFLGGTLFLFVTMFTGKRGKLDRWEAGILLGGYIAYMGYIVQQALVK